MKPKDVLQPCPFCGTEQQQDWETGETIPYTNQSRSCHACGCSTHDWNTRPIEDALRLRIAELEESDKHWAGNVKVCMQLIERYESDIAENDALQARAEKAEARLIELGDVIKLQKLQSKVVKLGL